MARTVKISDDLAARLEQRRTERGFDTLDAAAEAAIAQGLVADSDEADDHLDGRSAEEVRALIAEAQGGGAAEAWDAAAVRAEVMRRYHERNRQP